MAIYKESVISENKQLKAISDAYLTLLNLGMWEGRTSQKGQLVMIQLRDAIAEATGYSIEFVQNDYAEEVFRDKSDENHPILDS